MPTIINYVQGDATDPQIRPGVICHICNDIGKWGAGFVLAISDRWGAPETAYRQMTLEQRKLGTLQVVSVEPDLWVANIIGQAGVRSFNNPVPVKYHAVQHALSQLAVFCKQHELSVHMPRMGCGLAGGKWEHIEWIVKEELCKKGIEVTVYDFVQE